ncbi:gephyrin-like molybdotransferase receptor GlpR [Mycobacterium sp. WMMD1722]|uniref:divisome protein SepX/GlpR n=1 Tax=Mycobacterium sp. WMMD1722 TaxID=3404117 RepID=UPI003BF60DD5
MPSIPQSLLWISLVVLWLFVLVPMLISKRDAVRRTSDVALSTRVLNSGSSARLLRRTRPAAGHHSDPDWQPSADAHGEDHDEDLDEVEADAQDAPRRTVVLAAAATASDEPDYLDVDVVEEDSGALPIAAASTEFREDPVREEPVEQPAELHETLSDTAESEDVTERLEQQSADDADDADQADQAADADGTRDEYEYVADSSGLEASTEEDDPGIADSVSAARRRRYESKTAAAVSARKYQFRKRMVTGMAVALLVTGVAAYLVAPWAWWLCGVVGVVTALYLGYLRRQTRIEEQVRRRRAQRVRRSRLGVENTADSDLDVVPSRLRRPGAAVLEIDDEDPAFEHLDEVAFARHYDLPRAAGQ